MEERFVNIRGYEGVYQISNRGNVRSVSRLVNNRRLVGIILKPHKHSQGYFQATLSKNGKFKRFFNHRLVAIHFIPNPNNKRCVNHKDGNKKNNYVKNLEWCNYSENMQHAFKNNLSIPHNSVLNEKQTKEIYRLATQTKRTSKSIAEEFGVNRETISHIKRNKTWNHLQRSEPLYEPHSTKLSIIQIKEIYILSQTNISDGKLGKRYGVCSETVRNIRLKKKHKGVLENL